MNREEYLEDEIEIDLGVLFCDLWKGLKKMWILFAVICIACSAVAAVIPMMRYIPMYRATTSFSMGAVKDHNEAESTYEFYYDSATAEKLAKIFPYLLNSDIMQQRLKEKMGTDAVPGSLSIRALQQSNLFTMEAVSSNAKDAKELLDAAIECLPEVSRYVIGETKIKVLQPPKEPKNPIGKAFERRNLVKGFILGAGISMAILVVYALLRKTIKKEEDLKERLNMTAFGVIPQVKLRKNDNKVISILNAKTGRAFSENIRSIALKMMRKMKEQDKKVVMVTSTLPSEGKSTIAMNLALAMWEEGKKVILIDMDFRNPTQMKLLKLQPGTASLDQVLRRKAPVNDALLKVENGLYFLGCNKECKNVPALITKGIVGDLIEKCSKLVDYVIIDTPPCGAIGDAATISEYCDGVCYVIHQDVAKESQILDAMHHVSSHGCEILGGVLNGAESSLSGYGYGYGYGKYGKYGKYGYGYGKKKEK